MTPGHHVVRRAGIEDADTVTEILATSFVTDPISAWIFPVGDEERARRHPRFFRPFVDLALAEGQVYTTSDDAGVALWLNVDVTAPPAGGDDGAAFSQRVLEACGEFGKQFQILDEMFSAHHPSVEPHAYLMFVGVHPDRQNEGVGTALLCDRFLELDGNRTPTYLEASSLGNRRLYTRLGFDTICTLTLPGGPDLWPMWRPTA
jgi:ribosomal protein S18 acetylase RimI-like enzyme